MAGKRTRKVIQVPMEDEPLDRQYVDGYRRKPEHPAWAKASVRLLSKVLPREKW